MAWTDSRVGRIMVANQFSGAIVMDLDAPSDTYNMALYNNTGTPDKDATEALFRYNTGAWVVANEVIDTLNTNWIAKGRAISGLATTTPSTGVVMVDCTDVTGAGNVTLTGFFGTFTFNDTKANDPGVCYNYLGGTQTISNGPVTIVIDANGLFRATV